jgi:hypothetical protein
MSSFYHDAKVQADLSFLVHFVQVSVAPQLLHDSRKMT